MSDPAQMRRARRIAAGAAYALLILAAAVRLAPIQDETYYWTWGQCPGWSFVDHPPGIAFVLAASSAIFGDGLLGLRVPSLLCMAVVVTFSAAAARRLGGDAWGALLLLAGAPMFAVGYIPATPDVVQGALTAVSAYLLIRALEEGASSAWGALAGFFLCGSVIVKHSSAVLAAGVLGGLVLLPAGRRALARPAPWIGALCGFALLLPWLGAELSSASGSSFAYQETRVLTRGLSRGLSTIPIFFGGVLVGVGPAGGGLLFLRGAGALRDRQDPAKTALASGALLLLAACILPVLKGGGELNWSMPALVFALPILVVGMGPSSRRIALMSSAFLAIVLLHVAHPFLPISAKRDTTRRGAGFEAVAKKALDLAQANGARAIVTRRYQLASMIRYHTKDALPVLVLGSNRPSQYDKWKKPDFVPGDRALLVLPWTDVPAELDADPLAPQVEVARTSGGETIETLYMTPIVRRPAIREGGPT